MNDSLRKFKYDSEIAFNEEHWQKMNYNTGCYEKRFANSRNNYRNVELERERAFLLRNKSLLNMEKLLVDFETRFKDNGGQVLWACDADDALQMIWDIIGKRSNNSVSRSNSVVLDEIGIDDYLKGKGVQVYDSSIGRYILKVAGKEPYHPVYPALNLSKEEIGQVLNKQFKLKADSTTKQLVNFVRHQVNQDLPKAQICITGANYLLADMGGVVLSENEGNIVKSCASANIHIVVAGIDKVISSVEDLSILIPLTSAHATGSGMTSVNSITMGPSGDDGRMYVILLNNGRTDILENEVIRQSLSCTHCGACVSVCPIYKNIGGYAYGTPYIGPIGTVMTPLMYDLEEYAHLASLCSLCGRCTEVCPVKIPIEDLMIENRRIVAEERVGDTRYDSLVKTLIGHCKSRKKMDCPQWLKKVEVKQLVNKNNFTKRMMPELASKSFNQMSKTEN
ncbi:MAG: lactate utilization protein [Bacteroidales bacterium]|nr:lactate utilization protein [Bacteroidales bacterium]